MVQQQFSKMIKREQLKFRNPQIEHERSKQRIGIKSREPIEDPSFTRSLFEPVSRNINKTELRMFKKTKSIFELSQATASTI